MTMTTLSLERLHLPTGPASLTRRLRHGATAWSALVTRSVETSRAYDRAPTTSARHKVLAQFADTGA
jgi:hypothetical protein